MLAYNLGGVLRIFADAQSGAAPGGRRVDLSEREVQPVLAVVARLARSVRASGGELPSGENKRAVLAVAFRLRLAALGWLREPRENGAVALNEAVVVLVVRIRAERGQVGPAWRVCRVRGFLGVQLRCFVGLQRRGAIAGPLGIEHSLAALARAVVLHPEARAVLARTWAARRVLRLEGDAQFVVLLAAALRCVVERINGGEQVAGDLGALCLHRQARQLLDFVFLVEKAD